MKISQNCGLEILLRIWFLRGKIVKDCGYPFLYLLVKVCLTLPIVTARVKEFYRHKNYQGLYGLLWETNSTLNDCLIDCLLKMVYSSMLLMKLSCIGFITRIMEDKCHGVRMFTFIYNFVL